MEDEKEFIKPTRVTVDALDHLSKVFQNGLIKDLQENQVLCKECSGTGLEIVDQIYGLKNDPAKKHYAYFPYSNQYLIFCRNCYTGVAKLCEHCKEVLPRHTTRCECDKAKSVRYSEEQRKEKELLDKAIKLKHDDEIAKSMGMYYSEYFFGNNGYFSEWEDFIDRWNDENDPEEEKPQYVWGTSYTQLSLDANSILENACEDLHDDADENLEGVEELREYLNEWCEKQSGTSTYWQDTRYVIEIPWD